MAPQPSSVVWTGKLMPQFIGVAAGMMMGLCYAIGSIGAAETAVVGEMIGLEPALLISIAPLVLSALLVYLTPYKEQVRG